MHWPSNTNKHRRDRPYVYPPTVIVRCFVVRILFRLDSNNALHIFLNMGCHYNRKLALACGLSSIPPCRRTIDKRLKKTISADVKGRIATMGHLFVTEGLADPTVTAIDSTLLKANGSPWHKSSMKKGVVLRSGIDTDARWGYSHTRGMGLWIQTAPYIDNRSSSR